MLSEIYINIYVNLMQYTHKNVELFHLNVRKLSHIFHTIYAAAILISSIIIIIIQRNMTLSVWSLFKLKSPSLYQKETVEFPTEMVLHVIFNFIIHGMAAILNFDLYNKFKKAQ